MSKKINGDMTLFELKEHCTGRLCYECEFLNSGVKIKSPFGSCKFVHTIPSNYELYKPKTYKEDFLEKFPNIQKYDDWTSTLCVEKIYGTGPCDSNLCKYWIKDLCKKCWEQIMPEEE